MELQGKIIAALAEKSGTSARGDWKAQDFVIETHDTYPRKMVFSVFGADRLSRFNIQVGQEVSVSFDIDAHEYQGRWFNSIRAYDVRPINTGQASGFGQMPGADPFGPAGAQPASASPSIDAQPQQPSQPTVQLDPADDLPF